LFLVGLATFTAIAGALYLLTRSPLPEPDRLAETTILTDVNGSRLASIDAGEDRIPVPLGEVPRVLVDAVLAAEDRNFYAHGGVDPFGILRATVADLRGRPLQGGSTITQQYVKQAYLEPERSVVRKLREATIALKVERNYDKNEILERYLNTVYFGRGAYGVQAAALAYFAKDVGKLNLPEAAYLAGLIRAPEAADATRHPRAAAARRDRTLRAMRETHAINREQERSARARPISAQVLGRDKREPQIVGNEKGTGYFVEYVRAELVRRYGKDTTYQGGLRVKTSLDLRLQAQAYDAVYGFLDQPSDPAAALITIDDAGRVVTMVGGKDYKAKQVNYATGLEGGGSGRQAGSTFKPFLLAALLKEGYSVQSAFPAPPSIVLPRADQGKDYDVDNYELEDFGPSLSLIDATANSVNTVFVQAQEALGRQKVVDMAKQMGVRSDVSAIPSLVLGTEEVSVLDMASAFSTFAARGVHATPRVILEVRRADGALLARDRGPSTSRVLSTEQADVVTHCLRQVVLRGSGQGAKLSTQVAGKTGTTQEFVDAWFIGYTPKLTTAVWMGFPEGNEQSMTNVRGRKVNGGSFPATIFRRFMAKATADARYRGEFPAVTRFRGKPLAPPSPKKVVLGTTTTTSTSTPAASPTSTPTPTTTAAPTTTVPR
jgi:penicillin-binding protein 1A